jgi:DNA-binding response OmpR family regulator
MTKPLVLCVDDDLATLAALRRQLQSEPYDVITAVSAAQALAALRVRDVEVVVTDERMPGTNGSELLAEIRDRWPWIGRVILTGHPGQDVALRGLEVGVDFLLPKPWDGDELKQSLRRLVRGVERSHPRSPEVPADKSSNDVGGEGG